MTRSRRGQGVRVGAACVLALGLACSGESERATLGPAMGEVSPEALAAVEANRAPSFGRLRLEPRSPKTGESLRVDLRIVDPDGDPAWAEYEWIVDGNQVPRGADGIFSLERVPKGARIELRATPTDGRLRGESRTLHARIENTPPTISALELDHELPIQRGQVVGVAAEASDPDPEDREDLKLHYEWYVNDRATGVKTQSFDTGRLKRGDQLFVRVRASDGEDRGKPRDSEPFALENIAPQIVSTPAGLGADGTFHYKLEAVDPDGDRSFQWELVKAPEGMTLDSTLGEIHWTPGPEQAGEHEVEIHVLDGKGGRGGQAFPISVKAIEPEVEENAVPAARGRY